MRFTFGNMTNVRGRKKLKRIYSPVKQKILLLLAVGVGLSFAGTIGKQLRIIKEISREWKTIDRNYLKQIVREFYADRLISMKKNADGTITTLLTEKGKERALTFKIDSLRIPKPAKWDGRWHGVMFDIPEKYKFARHALRKKLRDLNFYHWQKSVYIHPYPCRDQVDFVVEFFGIRSHVRYGALTNITNEEELLLYFNLV